MEKDLKKDKLQNETVSEAPETLISTINENKNEIKFAQNLEIILDNDLLEKLKKIKKKAEELRLIKRKKIRFNKFVGELKKTKKEIENIKNFRKKTYPETDSEYLINNYINNIIEERLENNYEFFHQFDENNYNDNDLNETLI